MPALRIVRPCYVGGVYYDVSDVGKVIQAPDDIKPGAALELVKPAAEAKPAKPTKGKAAKADSQGAPAEDGEGEPADDVNDLLT